MKRLLEAFSANRLSIAFCMMTGGVALMLFGAGAIFGSLPIKEGSLPKFWLIAMAAGAIISHVGTCLDRR